MPRLHFFFLGAVVIIAAACAGEVNHAPSNPSTHSTERTSTASTSLAPEPTPDSSSAATTASASTPNTDTSYRRRSPFVPLDNPDFLSIENATYLGNDELVLGVEWGNEARAYPVQMLTYHHIVNDHIGGRPFLITY